MKSKTKWSVPGWMKDLIPLIANTGGNDVADMMNGNADPRVNLPLSTLQACVKSQVALLVALRSAGYLDPSLKDVERLCGYVANGTAVRVLFSQDDATRDFIVQVYRRTFYGPSLRFALLEALKEIPEENL